MSFPSRSLPFWPSPNCSRTRNEDVRHAATEALFDIGGNERGQAFLAITGLCKNKSDLVRQAAAKALERFSFSFRETTSPETSSPGRIFSPEGIVAFFALTELLKDKNKDVRRAAAETLWGLHSLYTPGTIGPEAKPAIPVLSESLKGKDEESRRAAALGLGDIGPEAKIAVPA